MGQHVSKKEEREREKAEVCISSHLAKLKLISNLQLPYQSESILIIFVCR